MQCLKLMSYREQMHLYVYRIPFFSNSQAEKTSINYQTSAIYEVFRAWDWVIRQQKRNKNQYKAILGNVLFSKKDSQTLN